MYPARCGDLVSSLRKRWGASIVRDDDERPGYGAEPAVRFEMVAGLSPDRVDREINVARRAGDVGHRAMAYYLADCADRGIYQQFGHPSVVTYAVKRHGISRRATRNLIAAGRALRELPAIDAAFLDAALSWSKVRALASVATPQTEPHWLAFALAHTVDELDAATARARKGDAPREDSKSVKPTRFNVNLRVSAPLHEQAVVARDRLRAEMGRHPTDDEFAGVLLEAYLRRPAESAEANDSLYRVVVEVGVAGPAIRSEDGPVGHKTLAMTQRIYSDLDRLPKVSAIKALPSLHSEPKRDGEAAGS